MCGITGICGEGNKEVIEAMTDIIEHRGPDDEGYFIDDGISLGNRRLSIIDLETGKQPIHNEDESLWITYNGELYNYRELREELRKRGHNFYTDTDTEVIVHSYEEWGEDCLEKFNGMFAFGIWNSKEEELFLARDRMGIKPLYFARTDDNFLFASEIKSLLQHPEVNKEINLKELHNFLSFKHTSLGNTILKGVKKLKPGHYLKAKVGKISIEKYWDIEFEPKQKNESYFKKKIIELLEDSVKKRLMSDVPLGLFLSGGIDSSTVLAIMQKYKENPVETFTVGFGRSDEKSELANARKTAEYFSTDHHEVKLEENDYDLLPEIMWHNDEPTGDPASLALYKLSKEASKHVKVVQNGTGGDEQFAGYIGYKLALLNNKINWIPKFLRNFTYSLASLTPGMERKKRGLKYVLKNDNYYDTFVNTMSIISEEEKKSLYSDEIRNKIDDYSSQNHLVDAYFNEQNDEPLNKMLYYDNKLGLVEDMLKIADKMTMAHSLESRVPILDHRIVELSASMPGNLKLKGWNEKYIFKKAMHEILPKEITQRKKRPFRIPLATYFQDNLAYLADKHLLNNEEANKFFKKKQIEKVLEKHERGNRYCSYKLFNILSFQTWYEKFIKSF